MDWKILARLGCPPKFLTSLRQLHEGQQSQVKHNESLSGSFPISNGVKQGWCVMSNECYFYPWYLSSLCFKFHKMNYFRRPVSTAA